MRRRGHFPQANDAHAVESCRWDVEYHAGAPEYDLGALECTYRITAWAVCAAACGAPGIEDLAGGGVNRNHASPDRRSRCSARARRAVDVPGSRPPAAAQLPGRACGPARPRPRHDEPPPVARAVGRSGEAGQSAKSAQSAVSVFVVCVVDADRLFAHPPFCVSYRPLCPFSPFRFSCSVKIFYSLTAYPRPRYHIFGPWSSTLISASPPEVALAPTCGRHPLSSYNSSNIRTAMSLSSAAPSGRTRLSSKSKCELCPGAVKPFSGSRMPNSNMAAGMPACPK